MDWTAIVSIVLNGLLSGGFIVTVITLKSKKKKAVSEARSSEFENVQEAISIWRETAESLKIEIEQMRSEHDRMRDETQNLRTEVNRLTQINSEMMKLLSKMNSDNFEMIITAIKKTTNDEPKSENTD